VQNAQRPDPKKLWDIRPLLKRVLVEAPGIEPGSEKYVNQPTTCVSDDLYRAPLRPPAASRGS
jgi:hypothetical protein